MREKMKKTDCHLDWITFTIDDVKILPQDGLWSIAANLGASGLYSEIYRTKSGMIVF